MCIDSFCNKVLFVQIPYWLDGGNHLGAISLIFQTMNLGSSVAIFLGGPSLPPFRKFPSFHVDSWSNLAFYETFVKPFQKLATTRLPSQVTTRLPLQVTVLVAAQHPLPLLPDHTNISIHSSQLRWVHPQGTSFEPLHTQRSSSLA